MSTSKLMFAATFVYYTFSVQVAFTQSSDSEYYIAHKYGNEANIKKNTNKVALDINYLYDYEKISSTEYYLKKATDADYKHDLFYLLSFNENLIIDTLSKSIKWKGKDFLEVQVNGKKLPYDEAHLYFFLKNLKSSDFQGVEIMGYSNSSSKIWGNVGVINIIR